MKNKFKCRITKAVEANKKNLLEGSLLKEEYFKLFEQMEAPTNKQSIFKNIPADFFENFEYEVYDGNYTPRPEEDYSKYFTSMEKGNFIVLINGFFSPEHSRIISDNIVISKLSEKIKKDYFAVEKYYITYSERHEYILSALNAALSRDGIFLNIKENAIVEEPIYILSVFTNQMKNYLYNQRFLILADKNSQATIIENVVSESNSKVMMMQVTELHQSPNSLVNYYRLNNYAAKKENLVVFLDSEFAIEENAVLNRFSINFNSTFSRNRTNVKAIGKKSEINLNSFIYVKNHGVMDIRTILEIASPEVRCNQFVKSIADENSRVNFSGKIEIEPHAQKVVASQKSRGILLSNTAEIFCEPQLEIYANDVVCSHGAAIGNVDDDLVFYLQSRGIAKDEAQKLLLAAYASEILDKIHIKELRDNLLNEFQNHLSA